VNTSAPHHIQSGAFDGALVVHVRDYVGPPGPGPTGSFSDANGNGNASGGGPERGRGRGDGGYFSWPERKGVTWSIQVRCVFFTR
jgi:hypothetical protein